jgi:DNA invertase Pin-like site-specific DNA recombinase
MKAIYIRTSTEEQEPENQISQIEDLSGKEYLLFQDKQGAWKENKEREQFENLKKQIKEGKISELYVWDLDRIYRDRKNLLGFFEFCKSFKCKVFSVRQKWLFDLQQMKLPQGFEWIGEMQINNFLNFLGWIAEEESSKKSERIKLAVRKWKGKATLSYKGKKWGRKPLKRVIEKVLELRKQGKKIREICSEVYYWDKGNHKKYISVGLVHKIVSSHKEGNTTQ